jgi:glycosyltransferase involved in cell wall biosynthesis
MNIVNIVPYFYPYIGGQEKYVYNLSKYLVKFGHDVSIITSDIPKTIHCEVIDGIKIKRYNCLIRILRNPIIPGLLFLSTDIKNKDIINIHNEYSFTSLMTYLVNHHNKKPIVLTNHGKLIFGDNLSDKFVKIYNFTIRENILDYMDYIVVNSLSDKDDLVAKNTRYRNKVIVLHNAIDPISLSLCEPFIPNLDNYFKILFVGNIIKRKGIEYLIKSIKLVEDKLTNIKCIIVGDGNDKHEYELLVKTLNLSNIVIFTGKIKDSQLNWLYKNSDVLVLPSLSEGCPTVVLEAGYHGLPSILSDIPGNRDHFKSHSFLVSPGNIYEISESLIKLYNNKELLNKMGEKIRKLIIKEYTWDVVTKEYINLYSKLI